MMVMHRLDSAATAQIVCFPIPEVAQRRMASHPPPPPLRPDSLPLLLACSCEWLGKYGGPVTLPCGESHF